MTKLLYTPDEAAEALAMGRTRLYAFMASGDLASVKVGASRRITADALTDFAAKLSNPTDQENT